ncbi:MAG: hypothetical protein JSU82_07340 [Rhodospirillales bacterium]|nr:MAG: hypothetical protein JSU82_07340 [Rhodospirillales bacterium]
MLILSCLAAPVAGITAASAYVRAGLAADILPAAPTDARYEIAGTVVQLDRGKAETPAAPGSATKIRTHVLGSPAFGDLDGDGDDDAVLWLVHDPGGSGTFHYIAAAINETSGFRGTSGVLVGDRIAPGEMSIDQRRVTVRFAGRRATEPMAATPTVPRVRHFRLASLGLVSEDAPQ